MKYCARLRDKKVESFFKHAEKRVTTSRNEKTGVRKE